MTKSRRKLLDSHHELQKQRKRLLRRLTQDQEMAIGTVSEVYRKCGNARCRCAKGEAHLQTIFLFNDEKQGRRRCKLVRRADEARLLKAEKRYREFRQDLKQLRAIDKQEKQILMALAKQRGIRYK